MTQSGPATLGHVPLNKQRAIDAVLERSTELWPAGTKARLQDAADVAEGTVAAFLAGRRWPRDETMDKIERAIGWPAGSIVAIAAGEPIPRSDGTRPGTSIAGDGPATVSDTDAAPASRVVLLLPEGWDEGLDPLEAAEIKFELQKIALARARELKAQRAQTPTP